jgi:hypothetical protein
VKALTDVRLACRFREIASIWHSEVAQISEVTLIAKKGG